MRIEMGLFDFFSEKRHYTEKEIMGKAIQGVFAYKQRNYSQALTHFKEYFELKGYGVYPKLDADDFGMYLNLMLCQFYTKDYQSCLNTCKTIIKLNPNPTDAYMFAALCNYKLGNQSEADKYWQTAKSRGNEIANNFDTLSDVKMQGYNC